MDTLSYKTISANSKTVNKQWVVVDAEGKTLGRFCSENAVFNPKGVFSQKQTAGRPRTGTQPKVIFTRNADFDAYCI